MLDPLSFFAISSLIVKSAPLWLPPIRDAFLGKAQEKGMDLIFDTSIDKSKKGVRSLFRLDEKEQARHLELVLKNALERGEIAFHTPEEQRQYRNIITTLCQPGPHSETLRREVMRLFSLNENPNFTELNEVYHRLLPQSTSSSTQTQIDAAPYLGSFFDALLAKLYADPFFRQQMSDVIQVRAAMSMQRSLTEVVATLRQIGETLADHYTPEQFEQDVQAYTAHIERTLRYLKLVGVVPKERMYENKDPELDGIFVPLRVGDRDQPAASANQTIIDVLAHSSCLVLLGGPGSGKSTAVRHLAWSHAVANQSDSATLTNAPLLPGKPLPLRIELRRLNEDRKQRPDYDFLTYASEVLLGRAGQKIRREMFEILLERRTMLILFDGLDEVATLDDRRTLVDEIESFVHCYPGNRFLVTSRTVGYELAPLSTQSFSQAHIQPFNDWQIHLFLEYWYTHVLRLSSLSPDDQQELEDLYTTMKNNPRLRSLAENPLLLTAITALHRYERLPDKRILVYDRCADLLLETWARVKGTNARWQDLMLSKDDQYACVAHLGSVLHERAQEKDSPKQISSTYGTAVDVPSYFIRRKSEQFLCEQKLFPSKAEQRTQAKRFLELIQEEAGLIVERGADENGELLYGFVHRTFQEYFAAVDIYKRYQQEEDPLIISDCLTKHLHDPHWREVILLLFGKLGRKPATKQLRQILEGKITSRRSQYTDILQQDLFFICDCLIEEIVVEIEFVREVILRLSDFVKRSPFKSQYSQALNTLIHFTRIQHYTNLAQEAIIALLYDQDIISDAAKWTHIAQDFYIYSPSGSNEQKIIAQVLIEMAQKPCFPIEQMLRTVQMFKPLKQFESGTQQFTSEILMALAQRPELSVEQTVSVARELYQSSLSNSKEQQYAAKMLIDLEQLPDISIEQAMQVAEVWLSYIYREYSSESKKHRRAITQWVVNLAQKQNISIEQLVQITTFLYLGISSLSYPEERRQVARVLLSLLQQGKLSFEETLVVISNILRHHYTVTSKQQVINKLLILLQWPDLSTEQIVRIVRILCIHSSPSSRAKQLAIQKLTDLTRQPDCSYEQISNTACAVYRDIGLNSSPKSMKHKSGQVLLKLMQQCNLSFEQKVPVAWTLCTYSLSKSEEYQQGLYELLDLAQRPGISSEQAVLAAQALYRSNYGESCEQGRYLLWQMALQPHYSVERAMLAALGLLASRSLFGTQYFYNEDGLQAAQTLLELLQLPDLPLQQTVSAALALHQYCLGLNDHPEILQQASQILFDLAHDFAFSFEQTLQVIQTLYMQHHTKTEVQKKVSQMLWQMAHNERFTIDQRVQLATIPLTALRVSYSDRAQAVQTLLNLLQAETARRYFEERWQQINLSYPDNVPGVLDIPYIFELITQEMLPTRARDEAYNILRQMVPQFDKLEEVEK